MAPPADPSDDEPRGRRPQRDESERPQRNSGRDADRGEGARKRGRARSQESRNRSPRSPRERAREVEPDAPKVAGPRQWGSLGRKGAARIEPTEPGHRYLADEPDERPDRREPSPKWQRTDPADGTREVHSRRRSAPPRASRGRDELDPKPRRGRERRPGGAGSGAADARKELLRALGPQRGERAADRLRDAAHAFERDRFEEARELLRPIAEAAPRAASVRELLGLTLYRLGRWNEAIRELESFRELARTSEQHPVLADSYRAIGRHATVEELWRELRDASPSRELVSEGRIVMAGSLGDRGSLQEAIDLLTRAIRGIREPRVDEMRQAYALADLYEKAGEVARARELFGWLARLDPDFADSAQRASNLS